MNNLKQKIQTLFSHSWFLFLLPVFFVFHGSNENYGYIPFTDSLKLVLFYMAVITGAALLLKIFLRKKNAAAITVFLLMCFYLFFGSFHDRLKELFPVNSFITRYIFLVPLFLLILLLTVLIIRKTKKSLTAAATYLNLLFLILIISECFIFIYKKSKTQHEGGLPGQLTVCNNCDKPDIYFLLFDEYAGDGALKEVFNFDNFRFDSSLKAKGFYIFKNSKSNYNYTPFSIASTFNMEYLEVQPGSSGHNATLLSYCYDKIKYNIIRTYFLKMGYQFINYSVFDFQGQPAPFADEILPVSTRLITAQTFLNRAQRDLGFNFITRFKSKAAIKKFIYFNFHNNNNIMKLTEETAATPSAVPRFIYAHIRMPHFPYYFDSNGNEQPYEKLGEVFNGDTSMYINYLRYSNNILTAFMDSIKKKSARPPIIILMSDHGFRHYTFPVADKYHFLNLNAVYFPDRNYASLPDSISAVNQFRVLLNARFGQHLPLLNDSTVLLDD